MSFIRKALQQLLDTLPAIILVTIVDVIICFTVGASLMLRLMPDLGRQHPHMVLGAAILTAVSTQIWILWNHKIRSYIKARSME
jgi:hypothetical protein